MIRFVIRLYDYMVAHKLVCALSFVVVTLTLIVSLTQLNYKEDISDFLPVSGKEKEALSVYQDISGANRIFIIFEQKGDSASTSPELIIDAIKAYESLIKETDSLHFVNGLTTQIDLDEYTELIDYIYSHVPYFLTPKDYVRLDSLLNTEDYIGKQLATDKEMLLFPSSSILAENISRDPLNLFTPILSSLQTINTTSSFETYDGYIFTPDMQKAIVMMHSPFGNSETQNNALLVNYLSSVADSLQSLYPNVSAHSIGGPVIAVQFDNEQRNGNYLMALKKLALSIGFDLPFYTRTGWPELTRPVPFGEMLPLFGDYADGFWDRSTKETAGNYYKAFNFKAFRSSTAIATEQLGEQKERLSKGDEQYPYFTCELGGGMIPSYHRRVYVYPEDAYSMAVVKLGSGSNLLGYYMYHGGTNPDGKLTHLNECQASPATNHNDLPVKSYEYYAPLGEYGQTYPHYYLLRKLHLFMHDFAETLAPMDATFPCPQDIKKGDDSHLRWAYRSLGDSGFVFVNNYERLQNLADKKGVQFDVLGVKFPRKPMTIPAGTACIFPVNIDGIKYATAQIIAKRDGKIYLEQIKGVPTEICVDGKTLRNVKPRGTEKPVYRNIYLLDSDEAGRLFLPVYGVDDLAVGAKLTKVREAGASRQIKMGAMKVAEQPSDADFDAAAVYTIDLPEPRLRKGRLLQIDYRGDVARLYAGGKLVADNFYNGRPFLLGLWRLPADCKQLELRILPLQKDMPVYFPREANVSEPGEEVLKVSVTNRL